VLAALLVQAGAVMAEVVADQTLFLLRLLPQLAEAEAAMQTVATVEYPAALEVGAEAEVLLVVTAGLLLVLVRLVKEMLAP